MSLLHLPNELLLFIANSLRCGRGRDINALARTNRQLFYSLDIYLYQYYLETSNHSALPWAAYHGLTNTVLKFLELGANVHATFGKKKRFTSLYLASLNGHLLIVEALIKSGAEIDAQTSQAFTSQGFTSLHGAVRAGHQHITRVLLESGADFMKRLPTKARPTILHVASHFGYTDIVQLLLNKGMGIQVKDENLQTPLHYAVRFDEQSNIWHGNITTVHFLLERKAVKDSWDRLGQRPKDFVKGHPNSIVELLLQNTNDTTLNGAILLDQAIQQQRQKKKELKEERIRKAHALAAERAARLKEKAMEAEEKSKEELLRKTEESAEYQKRMEKEKIGDISRYEKQYALRESWAKKRVTADNERLRREMEKARNQQKNRIEELKPASPVDQEKQDAAREGWGKLKAEAEGRKQISYETKRQPCSHSTLGLLKWKGKGQCNICKTTFAKRLFRCADCGFIACWQCNTVN